MSIADRFASMWKQSREDAGKSQAFMARELGVSRRTIQNWEEGTSSPSQLMGFRWFRVLDLPPLPYYLRLLYSDFDSAPASDEDTDKLLFSIIKSLPTHAKKSLLYCLGGHHGSSVPCSIEEWVANAQCPLSDRLRVAVSIRSNYEVAKEQGMLVGKENIQPDLELLDTAIAAAKRAVISSESSYSISEGTA